MREWQNWGYASDLKSDVRKELGVRIPSPVPIYRAVAKLVKVSDFDSDIRVFKSHQPCQNFIRGLLKQIIKL